MIGGIALVVTGLIVGEPHPVVEGAYFNRSVGAPAFAGVFATSRPEAFDPGDGNLWIGAGLALLLAGAAVGAWLRTVKVRLTS